MNWSVFVDIHPHGNIFQTLEMAEVCKDKIKKKGTKRGIYQKLKEKILGQIHDDIEEEEKCWNAMLE